MSVVVSCDRQIEKRNDFEDNIDNNKKVVEKNIINTVEEINDNNWLEKEIPEDYLYDKRHEEVDLNEIFQNKEGFIYQVDFKLEHVDAETFEILNYCFAKDKNNIYFFSYSHYGFYMMKEYDVETFESLGDFYAKDKNGVYFNGEGKIEYADIQTFKVLSTHFAKDKNNFYYYNNKIDIDYKTFEILEHFIDRYYFVKDKDGFYVMNYGSGSKIALEKIESIDPKTIELLEYSYLKDKDNIYYVGTSGEGYYFVYVKKLENVSVNNFEILDKAYSKDNNNCYKSGKIVDMLECDKINNK